MRRSLVVAAVMAATIGAAEAVCTKKSLDGNWELGAGTDSAPGVMADGSFSAAINGTTLTIAITSFDSNKCIGIGTGMIGANAFSVKATTEAIARTSGKPNHLMVTYDLGAAMFIVPLQRL